MWIALILCLSCFGGSFHNDNEWLVAQRINPSSVYYTWTGSDGASITIDKSKLSKDHCTELLAGNSIPGWGTYCKQDYKQSVIYQLRCMTDTCIYFSFYKNQYSYNEYGLLLRVTANLSRLRRGERHRNIERSKLVMQQNITFSLLTYHLHDSSEHTNIFDISLTPTWTTEEAMLLSKYLAKNYSGRSDQFLFNFIITPDWHISLPQDMQDMLRKRLIFGNLYMTSTKMQELTDKPVDYTGQILLIVEELYSDKTTSKTEIPSSASGI